MASGPASVVRIESISGLRGGAREYLAPPLGKERNGHLQKVAQRPHLNIAHHVTQDSLTQTGLAFMFSKSRAVPPYYFGARVSTINL